MFLAGRVLQGDHPMIAMIIIMANIFLMFTTCQALGLELYRYYHSIHPMRELPLSFHFRDEK